MPTTRINHLEEAATSLHSALLSIEDAEREGELRDCSYAVIDLVKQTLQQLMKFCDRKGRA